MGNSEYTLTSGDILYFMDREGYRNSRPENIGAHAQYPSYVVVGARHFSPDGDHHYSLLGIKRQGGAIRESEAKFFNRVGELHDLDYDQKEVKADPYYFSRLYASGEFCIIPEFLKRTLISLSTYFPHVEKNKTRIGELMGKETLTPSESMEVSLYMMRNAYLELLQSNKGNVTKATEGMMNMMVQTSRNMTKKVL